MMNYAVPTKSPSNRAHWAAVAVLALAALCPLQALAQVPGRFYWKPLAGANAVPVIFNSISGNTNPFDRSNMVMPDAKLDANMALVGYASVFELADRAAMAAVILPMGNISGGVAGVTETSRGFGDPMLEFTYNVIGPKAQRNIPDAQRYQPGFQLDLLADLAIPIGEYDNKQSVNLGQNRWYGRIGAPIVWQLGDWVPGRRTTLEFLPAVWLFGDNNDFTGKTLKTDPMFQLDAHLTRDFTKDLWGALDMVYYRGGGSTINGVEGGKLNNVGVGLTLGYTINDNLALTFGYKTSVNDSKPTDVRMDAFMVTLTFGWHPLIEGMKRLKSE
ncbi:MAG TPA: transporter [Quisquiliibacterium sp.]|nr:transporter [Quisquiliibacterium sp.]